jgi:membrane peptidoglycan carboxypeptidase
MSPPSQPGPQRKPSHGAEPGAHRTPGARRAAEPGPRRAAGTRRRNGGGNGGDGRRRLPGGPPGRGDLLRLFPSSLGGLRRFVPSSLGGLRRFVPTSLEGLRRFIPSWKIVLGAGLLGWLLVASVVGVAYAMTPVPKDPTVAGVQDQGSLFYYRDGKTLIGRIGTQRQKVPLSQVPEPVQNAVLSAEDRSFRSNPGFSLTGIIRAVWNDVTGGSRQGGSTITQQLAKNYYSDPNNRTMSRKFKELFISVKLERRMRKEEILGLYLNTVYFGRNVYGIQAASQEYFHTDVGKLRQDQAALLAGIIQSPNRDPADSANAAYVTQRYRYTLDGLVSMGKLGKAQAGGVKARLPKVSPARGADFAGQKGYLLRRTLNALQALGITQDMVGKNGYRIVTTWDKDLQEKARRAVEDYKKRKGFGSDVRIGLASVDVRTGEMVAAYGGPDYLKQFFDDAYQSRVQAGSSFKPYVLAAGLRKGIGLRSQFDTRSPITFDGQGNPVREGQPGGYTVHNDKDEQFGVKDLVFSTAHSINTVYVPLGLKAGLGNVVSTAVSAGVPRDSPGLTSGLGGVTLGQTALRPLDQAVGFATFANSGTYVTPHSIRAIYTDAAMKKPYKKPVVKRHKAFGPQSAGVAADTTYALQAVVRSGTGTRAQLPDGRPVAGKTGTTNENKAAWFVGYTPQLSTSVAMWRQRGQSFLSLRGIGGYSQIYGGQIPADIWRDYMSYAMRGQPVMQFPPPVWMGRAQRFAKQESKKDRKGKCRDLGQENGHGCGHRRIFPPKPPNCPGSRKRCQWRQ